MKEQENKMILKDAYKKIKQLIAEEKWLDAHRACLEILRFDPDNIKIIRLKNIVEKKVRKINVKAIKEDLKKLKPLGKKGKYEELLEHLKELEPYVPDYPPLKKIIAKAQNEYKKIVTEKQKNYFFEEIENIKDLLKKKKYQEALRNAEKLRILKMNEKEVREWITKIRTTWIDNELKLNEALLKSSKYEDILIFLQKIKRIYPEYEKLNRIIDSFKKKNKEFQIEQKKDFIYIGIEKTRTLIQLKKYEKAVQAAREILDIDPENSQAKRLHLLASKKESKQMNRELVKQMTGSSREMKKLYKKNKKDFKKI